MITRRLSRFYETLKLMFVLCVMVSYPIQFFVPMERVEKFIIRKCAVEKQTKLIYFARLSLVIATLGIAELVPHLALFISLIGAFAGTSLALLFPPIIRLLVSDESELLLGPITAASSQVAYAQRKLTFWVYAESFLIFGFA